MDMTGRKIIKIAREAEKPVLLSLRDTGVGTAEIDFIHTLRHHPGAMGRKVSKAETEAAFCDYLTATLTGAERETFASLLDRLYTVPKSESRAGFPHFLKQ